MPCLELMPYSLEGLNKLHYFASLARDLFKHQLNSTQTNNFPTLEPKTPKGKITPSPHIASHQHKRTSHKKSNCDKPPPSQYNTATMLRRKPTAITLTTEDIATYEDRRVHEAQMQEQAAMEAQMRAQHGTPFQQQKSQNVRDPNDELRPLPGDRSRAPVKTREERLGLGMGNAGGSRG